MIKLDIGSKWGSNRSKDRVHSDVSEGKKGLLVIIMHEMGETETEAERGEKKEWIWHKFGPRV